MTRKEKREKRDMAWAWWLTVLICILIANILARDQPSIIPYEIVPYRIDIIIWASVSGAFFGMFIAWLFGFGVEDELKWMFRGTAITVLSGLSFGYLCTLRHASSEIWFLRYFSLLLAFVGVILTKELILIWLGFGATVIGCYVLTCEYGLILYSQTIMVILLVVLYGIPIAFIALAGAPEGTSGTKKTPAGGGIGDAEERREEKHFFGPPGKHYDEYGNYIGESEWAGDTEIRHRDALGNYIGESEVTGYGKVVHRDAQGNYVGETDERNFFKRKRS